MNLPQVTGQAAGELACRPGSVHPLARAGGHPSTTAVAGSLLRSTREHRAGRPQALARSATRRARTFLTLLRVGFTKPPQSPAALVGSYTTVSPLHPGHPGSALPTPLPCGARTFLGALRSRSTTRPPGRLARRIPRIGLHARARGRERAHAPPRPRLAGPPDPPAGLRR